MDDFAIPEHSNIFDLPPSPANYIAPYKRPLTSMCPSILLDEHGDVELLVGSAGGSKITSAVAYVRNGEIHDKFGDEHIFMVLFIYCRCY